ncbi:signal transduction histidine kinase [Methylopila jiangsuensis]|uniref:histidine kinase n=1 Tax=Methylopila jiangsuensis TaxID=586230 RepID=A0A9W6N3L5_9HYPH|nr:PAS domain-containing sensor histidine kinase [Methylopila jiangsuensis]MDR6284064.1 two-component system cell cycle sensor histidine kinase PleC [Methylopila jiangsuensis]GLK76423.1 signal transduction histidine kinase [Methylopila jiangsuensis]
MIGMFLLLVGAGAALQAIEVRSAALRSASDELELLAAVAAHDMPRLSGRAGPAMTEALTAALPRQINERGRRVYVTDEAGRVIAALGAPEGALPDDLVTLLGATQPLTTFGERAGVMTLTLPSGETALATVRGLAPGRAAQVALVQSVDSALEGWRAGARSSITLFAASGFALALLGLAFHWQAARARSAAGANDDMRQRVDTALARGRCGLFDWDVARGRIFWSRSLFELMGYPARDALISFGEFNALIHPEDSDFYALADEIARGATTTIDRMFRIRDARGEWMWLRARGELVRNAGDDGPRLIGICVDVTEQRTLAERTATADMRLRDAIETISEAFVLWDSDNRLVMCNSKFQHLYELNEGSVFPGARRDDIIAVGRQPVIVTPVKPEGRVEEGARTYDAQIEDGRWLHINERRTKDGGFVSVGTDITSLKRQEERLMESERALIANVADLRKSRQTLEVQAQQLADLAEKYAEQKSEAESASKAKSDFLANISHELRTPLNAIIGFSEIMESGMFGDLGSEKYYEYCRDIRESGQHLLDVINDVLDMSKIEAGRFGITRQTIDIDKVVLDAMRVITPRAEEKSIALRAEAATGVTVEVDRRALKQILLNLLSNAVKFTPAGGRITVRTRAVGGAMNLYIEDTGIGIPKEALPKLGRPFEQVESQFSKSHKGSGLGLAISRSLTELHGGAMRIRSTVGAGTVVLVRLPLRADQPMPEDELL